MLVHHADAVRDGVSRGIELHSAAIHMDAAGLRLVKAGQHVHQAAFAGAVLPQQRMDLALF
jgi:hypothetical protein